MNVDRENICKSITKKTSTKHAGCGTTQSATSKRFAGDATSPLIERNGTTQYVQFVRECTAQDQLAPVAQKNADVKCSNGLGQNSTGSRQQSTLATSAESNSRSPEAGGNIAQENACVEREQKNKQNEESEPLPDTFWEASKLIIQQCHTILRPGGMAIWICKDFVRKGKRVPFSDQWQALCEAQGFRLACRHRAMMVAHHGEQDGLFGEATQVSTSRKSFFRRLAEAKGSPPIDFEDVICLQKEASV